MIVTVFVRRLKEGATFADFVTEWEADEGFGVPTRVFNAQNVEDPREVISIGFVGVSADELQAWLAHPAPAEADRHDRIDTVIETTSLRNMYSVRTEHDFSQVPRSIDVGSAASLLRDLC